MEMANSIAAMSVSLHQASLQSAISTAILDKTLDTQKQQGQALVQNMSNSSLPSGSVGSFLDTYA